MRALWIGVLLAASGPGSAAASCSATSTGADMVKGKDMSGQTHVLTGGDSGIGFETAMALASVNATVIVLSYDAKGSGATAVANITTQTGNKKVRVVQADLSDLSSVRSGAADVLAAVEMINVLVCDAGIAVNPHSMTNTTTDGYDRTFEVNLLGHVLLIELLLPKIRTAEGRIIHVSSDASFYPCSWANRDDNCSAVSHLAASAKTTPGGGTNPMGVPPSNYGLTKFLQVFHANEVARREHSQGPPMGAVMAFSLHPGFVQTPMTGGAVPPAVVKEWCVGEPQPCPLNRAQGAATPAYLATAAYSDLLPHNGQFFTWCAPAPSVRDLMVNNTNEVEVLAYQAAVYDEMLEWVK